MERKHAKGIVLGVSTLAGVGAIKGVFGQYRSSAGFKTAFNTLCTSCHACVYGSVIGIAGLAIGTVLVDYIFDKKEKKDEVNEEPAADGVREEDPNDSAFAE